MRKAIQSTFAAKTWLSIPLAVRAVIIGSLVSGLGVGVWGALLGGLRTVWVIVPTLGYLWVYWRFFGGTTGRWAVKERRQNFRGTKLTPFVLKMSVLLAALFVLAVQSSFVITYRLIDFPAAKFTADYKIIDSFPLWQAWLILIMGSIVAGICEEVGFRGYMQVPMEKQYGPVVAVGVTSLVFTCTHLSHTWAIPILPHIFFASVLLGIIAYRTQSLIPGIIGHSILDIFDYSIWWTDITGGFTKRPISVTGVDVHFVIAVLVFCGSVWAFFRVTRQLKTGGGNSRRMG